MVAECIVYVKTITEKKASLLLLSVNGQELKRKIAIVVRISSEVYNELLNNFNEDFLIVKIDSGEIIDVKLCEDDKYKVKDSNFVIVEMVKKNGGEMKKEDFYKQYMEKLQCTDRTALNHLTEAKHLRLIEDINHYTIKLVEEEEDEKK